VWRERYFSPISNIHAVTPKLRRHSTSTAIQNQWTSNLRAELNFQRARCAVSAPLWIASSDAQCEDVLARWTRQRPPPPAPCPRSEPTSVELAQLRAREWDDWIRGYLNAERENLIAGLGAAFGEARAELRDRIAALESRVDSLTADLAKQRAITEGAVVDLPPVIRKRSDNAV
jgi:hypothetical protein